MPRYDYECKKCGVMELQHSITVDRVLLCPECGSKEFTKLISKGTMVQFNCGGFYETDYKTKKGTPE